MDGWIPQVINQFMGRMNIGDLTDIPMGRSVLAENVDFSKSAVFTRPGIQVHLSVDSDATADTVLAINRIRRIKFASDGVVRYLVLYVSTSGLGDTLRLYDNQLGREIGDITTLAGIPSGIDLTEVDFKAVMVFDRCYISVYYRGGAPIVGTSLVVYEYGQITAIISNFNGTGYASGDLVYIIDNDADSPGTGRGGVGVVTVVAGLVSAVSIDAQGTRYTTGTTCSTRALTGAGDNALTVNITVGHPVAGRARAAAGAAPSGFTLGAATSGATGTIETGRRLFAVAFETESGYITAPGPTSWTLFNQTTANRKITISSIPIGPTGTTAARHILASRKIFNYNAKTFNQLDHELFFVPDGRIGDNTRTSFDVDFLDSELIQSADYLIDQLAEIPAGPILLDFNGRLLSGGALRVQDSSVPPVITKGAYAIDEGYVLRASKQGAPESFDSVVGFANIAPDDAGGQLYNAEEDRGIIYLFKEHRTYATIDSDPDAINWKVNSVDSSIGTRPDGVSKILDGKGNAIGGLLVAHSSGLKKLNGTYEEIALTDLISTDWEGGPGNQDDVMVLIDPIKKKIYCGYGPISEPYLSSGSGLLVADFRDGMNPANLKWTWWRHVNLSSSLYFSGADNDFKLSFSAGPNAAGVGKLFYFNSTSVVRDASLEGGDNQLAINSYFSPHPLIFSDDESLIELKAIRVLAKGSGTINISVYDRNMTLLTTLTGLTLSSTLQTLQRIANVAHQRMLIIVLSTTTATHWMHITKIVLFGNVISQDVPA